MFQKIKTVTEESRLIVLPEMFSTGFGMDKESLAETMDGTTVEWMKKGIRKEGYHHREYNRPGGPERYNELL
jgi:predicted amidohydrolase